MPLLRRRAVHQGVPDRDRRPGSSRRSRAATCAARARTIFEQNILGYSCARVCPVEVLCVGSCVYKAWQRKPIAIGRLQRFATETATARRRERAARSGAKAPSGQARRAASAPGPRRSRARRTSRSRGTTRRSSRSARSPAASTRPASRPYKLHADDALARGRVGARRSGVEIRTGVEVGKDVTGAAARCAEYDAVFLGLGLGADRARASRARTGRASSARRRGSSGSSSPSRRAARSSGACVVVGGGNTAHRRRARVRAARRRGRHDGLPPRRARDERLRRTSWRPRARTACASSRTACPWPYVRDATGTLHGLRVATDRGRQARPGHRARAAGRPRRRRHRPVEAPRRSGRSSSPASRSTPRAASSSTPRPARTGNPQGLHRRRLRQRRQGSRQRRGRGAQRRARHDPQSLAAERR